MSFNLIRYGQQNLPDIATNYLQLAQELCCQYYNTFDANIKSLANIYYPTSQFTIQEFECIGFNNFVDFLTSKNINKITHHNIHITAQPIKPSHILITTTGIMTFNDLLPTTRFVETLLFQREDNNIFKIHSTILKTLE